MSDLQKALEDIKQTQQLVEGLGLPLDRVDEMIEVLHRYRRAKDSIADLRDEQFLDDAWNLWVSLSVREGSKVDVVRFLRKFAEHIAQHTLRLSAQYSDLTEIIDHIPTMDESFWKNKENEEKHG
ncbi:hypothetical protein KSF_095590 [Reticulibacter mediterranei]|uniref:Uncharacterized protein n=1 Tax=Reticulibacter mediterranei TaxID=2778369 RepID=A0A8J3J0T5_9CHLR|nr:hypothetical protein [Reticulibacter mediterranei]GHO99511.1 hypothetical protein KSF_095590 [Reticulibacter mediterranei]